MATQTTTDERITKRRVTMRSYRAVVTESGKPAVITTEAVDYVRPDFLDAYLEQARANWDDVQVSEEPDAGPAGYHGATSVPDNLAHPLAGQTFAATEES